MKTFLVALCFIASTGFGQNYATNYSTFGELIVTQLVSAPFPHTNRADGHKYQDEFFSAAEHYSDSTVAIFIPKGFRETGRVDFVIHFHGWHNTVEGTLKQYRLIEQLVASGRNAVLVVPEGPHDAPDSFGGKLEDPDGFKRFINEVAATLKEKSSLTGKNFTIGDIILSGHSGGYHVMGAIVDHGGLAANVREVWLFDALYGQTENFLAWADQRHGRLLDIYTDQGGTTNETFRLMKLLKDRGTAIISSEDVSVTPRELMTNKFVFLHTDLAHNDVVGKRSTFTEFLKTSCLSSK